MIFLYFLLMIALAIALAILNESKKTNKQLKETMALIDDLNTASANLIAKNDALIALVAQLVAAAQNNPPPAAVQAVIDSLNAEATKDDGVLNPPPQGGTPAA
jgi:hypothetical protein